MKRQHWQYLFIYIHIYFCYCLIIQRCHGYGLKAGLGRNFSVDPLKGSEWQRCVTHLMSNPQCMDVMWRIAVSALAGPVPWFWYIYALKLELFYSCRICCGVLNKLGQWRGWMMYFGNDWESSYQVQHFKVTLVLVTNSWCFLSTK